MNTRMGSRMCRVGAAAVVVLSTANPAAAFYWVGWPGSGVIGEQTLLPSSTESAGATGPPPSLAPAAFPAPAAEPLPPPRGDFGTPTPGGPVPPPEQVPEPGTIALGLIGVGAVVARRWARKA